jgi:tetratricopeptide (TPR) repeat protein
MTRTPTHAVACLAVLAALASQAPRSAPAAEPRGRNYAFLVAGQDYDRKELRPLQYTRNDITEFYRALLDAAFAKQNVVLMHDGQPKDLLPEARKVRKELGVLLAGLRPDDTVIVALAGHGVQFRGEARSYFCPVDAELTDRSTLIPLDEVYRQLAACPARRKLLLVDACRNDPQSELSRGRPEVRLESVTRPQAEPVPKGIIALFSCSEGEKSFEQPELQHGLFFYEVLQGWQGDAADKEGKVTLDGLTAYVKEHTTADARLRLKAVQVPEQRGEFSGTWVLAAVSPGRARYRQGADALDRGDYDLAVRCLSEAIRLDPNSAKAYSLRGAAWDYKGQPDRALPDCDEAIRLDPAFAPAYNNRGWTHILRKEYDQAVADLDQAVRLDPQLVWAYTNRGWAHILRQDYDRALADLTEAIRLDPKQSMPFNNRAMIYLHRREYDRAVADCTEALRLDPGLAMAYNNRGLAYSGKGDDDRAVTDYTRAIGLDPNYIQAYGNRANAYERKGDPTRARADRVRVFALQQALANR